jgi:uncharacterized membrane protein YkvA (DUF1232 family)
VSLPGKLLSEMAYYKALASDPSVPMPSKWLIAVAIAYLLSPIDLIPDFIPFIGHLDDLIIAPLLIWLALSLVPSDIKDHVRRGLAKQ